MGFCPIEAPNALALLCGMAKMDVKIMPFCIPPPPYVFCERKMPIQNQLKKSGADLAEDLSHLTILEKLFKEKSFHKEPVKGKFLKPNISNSPPLHLKQKMF